jgi:rubrerythrin
MEAIMKKNNLPRLPFTANGFIKWFSKKRSEKNIIHKFAGFTCIIFGEKHCRRRMIKIKRFIKKGGAKYEAEKVFGCLVCGYTHEEHQPGSEY